MKYCSVCGQELADSASVCTKCGSAQIPSITKYCPKCGKKISVLAKSCPYCFEIQPTYAKEDSNSFGLAFLCFLIPIVGLILYLVWKREYPLRANSCGTGALVSIMLSVLVILLLISFSEDLLRVISQNKIR